MHADRLLNVAKALRESPNPGKFSMAMVHQCGTPACAIGHYAARRDLQSYFQLPTQEALEYAHADTRGSINQMIVGVWGASRLCYWSDAAASHFGITEQQVEELFDFHGCRRARSANEAAEYIENFVARHSEVSQS